MARAPYVLQTLDLQIGQYLRELLLAMCWSLVVEHRVELAPVEVVVQVRSLPIPTSHSLLVHKFPSPWAPVALPSQVRQTLESEMMAVFQSLAIIGRGAVAGPSGAGQRFIEASLAAAFAQRWQFSQGPEGSGRWGSHHRGRRRCSHLDVLGFT